MFDQAFPDTLDNALAVDAPTRKPPPGFFSGSGRALLTAPAAAGLDVLSMASPLLEAYGKAVSPTLGVTQEFLTGKPAQAAVGEGDVDFGKQARADVKRLTPDPATTGAAANIVFSVGRVLSKAIPLAIVGGVPVAAIGTGTVEGVVEGQTLTDEGVDIKTAAKVGAVRGVTTAAQLALPLSVASKAGTAALIAAGGPGGFMAEQAASRYILDNADYHEIARRYDPLDPTGLIVSTLIAGTFGVGGHMVRAKVAEKAAQPEITPELQAAARVIQSAEHVQETGLHQPGDLAGAVAHVDAIESAARAIDEGKRVDVSEFISPEIMKTPAYEAAVKHLDEQVITPIREAQAAEVVRLHEEMPGSVSENLAQELRLMARESGWEEVGGKLLRATEDFTSPDYNTITGRTSWIPRAEWFARMRQELGRTGLGVKENISIGVEKYINGEKLTANELRTVNWMKQEIADLQRIYENAQTARLLDDQQLNREQVIETAYMADNEISRQGLQRSDHLEVQEAALAARLDENAFDAAVKKHEGDDAGFRAEVRRIIYEKQGAQSSGGGEGRQQGTIAIQGSDSAGTRPGAGGRAEPRQADQASGEAIGREAAGVEPAAETAGTLKKAPDAIETAARKAVETNPDALVPNPETGALTSVKQLMTDAEAIYKQQVKESVAYKAAVNCFVGH